MSPFFLNGPETTARQSAPSFRRSLLLLLQTYHRAAPTASPTSGELSPDPEPQPQPQLQPRPPPAAPQPKTAPSHLGIMFEVSAPAPERPLTTGRLVAIPEERSEGLGDG